MQFWGKWHWIRCHLSNGHNIGYSQSGSRKQLNVYKMWIYGLLGHFQASSQAVARVLSVYRWTMAGPSEGKEETNRTLVLLTSFLHFQIFFGQFTLAAKCFKNHASNKHNPQPSDAANPLHFPQFHFPSPCSLLAGHRSPQGHGVSGNRGMTTFQTFFVTGKSRVSARQPPENHFSTKTWGDLVTPQEWVVVLASQSQLPRCRCQQPREFLCRKKRSPPQWLGEHCNCTDLKG